MSPSGFLILLGTFHHGFAQGLGQVHHVETDSLVYTGFFKDSKYWKAFPSDWVVNSLSLFFRYHGWGQLTLQKGVVYTGFFEEGEMHGLGRLQWPEGDSFCGYTCFKIVP